MQRCWASSTAAGLAPAALETPKSSSVPIFNSGHCWPMQGVKASSAAQTQALLQSFLHEDKLFFSTNLSSDAAKSRGDVVSYCWSLQCRAGCER